MGNVANFGELTERLSTVRNGNAFISVEGLILYDHKFLADAIYEGLPGAKILVTTRGPAGYLKSSYANSVRGGVHQDLETFAKTFVEKHMTRSHNLKSVISAFGKDNVLFLPFEMIKAEKERYLNEVGQLLGIDLVPYMPETGRNISPPPMYLELIRRLNGVMKKEGNAEIMKSPEWVVMLDIAFHAVGYAGELWPDFESKINRAINDFEYGIPMLPEGGLKMLAELSEPIHENPLYEPFLSDYGLE